MKHVKFLLILAVAIPLSVSAQDTENGNSDWETQLAREVAGRRKDFANPDDINFRGGRDYAANAGDFFHGMGVKHPHNQRLGTPDYYIAMGWTAENALAAQQTGFQQLGNGFLKGVVMVVQVPLGCVGLVVGIVGGIVDDDFASGFNACPLWRVMEDIYDWTDWTFPIYRSKDYEESTIIGKFFTCTFWAEALTYMVPYLILIILVLLLFIRCGLF